MKKSISVISLLLFVLSCATYRPNINTDRSAVIQNRGQPTESYQHNNWRLDYYWLFPECMAYLYRNNSLVAYCPALPKDMKRYLLPCINSQNENIIRNKKIIIGLSSIELVLSWSWPDEVNRYQAGTVEQWIYRGGGRIVYVYLYNDKVDNWQSIKY